MTPANYNPRPPGNTAPRFLDLRDGGDLSQPPSDPLLSPWVIWCAIGVIAFVTGMML
jgi:hypothetical protein